MKHTVAAILCAIIAGVSCSKPSTDIEKPVDTWYESGTNNDGKAYSMTGDDYAYINNGKVQIAIDLKRGGGIFHFSDIETKRNLLNHVDEGRFVQQSYYGDADGSYYEAMHRDWVWNPVQGGGANGVKGEVLRTQLRETELYVITKPVNWAAGELLDYCRMYERITLSGRTAKITFSFSNSGEGARDNTFETSQEMPAVFCDWALCDYVFYGGEKPWTNDELTTVTDMPRLDLGGTNVEHERTEEWSAYVDKSGWGLGVYTPGTFKTTGYRFGSGPGGPAMGSCSYFAPIRQLCIHAGDRVTYDVYMTIGTIDEIRRTFYEIHKSL